MKLTNGFVLFKIKITFLKNGYFKGLEKRAFANLWSRNLFAWIQNVKEYIKSKI